MDGGHETLLDPELVIDDLGEWRQAVGGAGRVGDNVHAGLVAEMVNTHHEHRGVRRGSRYDNLGRIFEKDLQLQKPHIYY